MNIKSFKHYHNYFASKYCLAKLFSDICKNIRLKTLSIHLNDVYFYGLQNYLKERYLPVIHQAEEEIKHFSAPTSEFDGNIFVCWFQGIENAPELVKQCFYRLKENANGHKITLLTDDNVFDIVQLPKHVLEKYQAGIITKTHLTDIIRTYLIYYYGGIWIDATTLTTNPLSDEVFKNTFYSIKKKSSSPYFIPNGRWAAYFLASHKNCPFGFIIHSVLLEYWKTHEELIDYFLIDHIINLCYENSQIVKQLVDSVPQNNPDADFFKTRYNNPFDEAEWESVNKNTNIFKLSYKAKIEPTKNNTYYTILITPPHHQVTCIDNILYAPSKKSFQEAA